MKHWIYGNKAQFFQWVDMLLFASYNDNEVIFDGTPVKLLRGELIGSTRYFASRWKVCKQTAQNFIRLIESEGMVTRRRAGRYTIYKIVNYDKYQLGASLETHPSIGHFSGQSKEVKRNNSKTSFTPSREQDLKFYELFIANEQYFASISDAFQIPVADLKTMAQEFRRLMLGKQRYHKDQTDYNEHFFNWVNREKFQKGAGPQNYTSNGSQDKYAARRGSDVSLQPDDDDSTF